MKRLAALAVFACLSGCSNAPVAGFLDYFFPSKASGTRPPDRLPPADRIPPADIGPPVGPGGVVPSVAPPKN